MLEEKYSSSVVGYFQIKYSLTYFTSHKIVIKRVNTNKRFISPQIYIFIPIMGF